MDWTAELSNANNNLDLFRKAQPAATKGFSALHHATMQAGAVGAKEKELIALSIGIAQQCIDCIGFHVKAAIAAGASRDEVSDVLAMTIQMGGGPAMMYAAKALDCFDELSNPS